VETELPEIDEGSFVLLHPVLSKVCVRGVLVQDLFP
jgi:hypothetical protein